MISSCEQIHTLGPVRPPASVHPLGASAKVLLTSVFGPYAQDDEYGSRVMDPMELYHNQVTRTQGPFSLRMFHRSWGIMMIQANIEAPCAVLDFPSLQRFVQELRDNQYDIVGITSIPLNVLKVRKMCELIRQYQPHAKIVIGGHIANMLHLDAEIDADFIVKGEGIRWFRRYLGEDEERAIRHPEITSGVGTRSLGVAVKEKLGNVAATLIPSVGCPLGCNFCSTSAMFGGKGKFVDFYTTGDELFDVMCRLEESMKVESFFVMDENFLLHRKRALRLLELMRERDKAWALYVFSSGKVLCSYTLEQLIGLGISWVWMGLEGENSQYKKLHGVDTRELVRRLQAHGIHVLGSTIIGLEDHSAENIDQVIDYAVAHDADFHQFMLYTPVEGTPLHADLLAQGRMKDPDEFHPGDIHGQLIFGYRHPHIENGDEAEFLVRAFDRDFELNGPSVLRVARTGLAGWQRYKDCPDARVRRRFAREAKELATTYAAAAWAAHKFYRHNPAMRAKMAQLLRDLYAKFGWQARLCGSVGGRYVYAKLCREQKRLAGGWTYEPPTFYEKNAHFTDAATPAGAAQCRYVTPRTTIAPSTVELQGSHRAAVSEECHSKSA